MLTVLLAGASLPSRATAALPGPNALFTGFTDDATFRASSSATSAQWLARAQVIGSSWVRIGVHWANVAPARLTHGFQAANPGDRRYRWSSLDTAVRNASAHGQSVVLLLFDAPTWAQGPHRPSNAFPGAWRPSPSALGAFARAVAERYSGHFADPTHAGSTLPLVTHFQAWNEPNLRVYLMPQWNKTAHGAFVPASPKLYRPMLNAVYASVKAVQPHAYVLTAGTAPYGDPPGVDRMPPQVFVRELLCLSGASLRPERCPDPAHFDALDHHPYSVNPTARAFSPGGVSVPDIWKLQRILRAAERSHRALPAGPKAIWITEIDWGSSPPASVGIPLSRQAAYLSLAFFQFWRQGVGHVLWFLIRDNPLFRPVSFTGAGVFFGNGRPKPSATAFHFPFVALRGRHGIVTLWGRAPAVGVVSIERQTGGTWQSVGRLSTTSGGIFFAHRRLGTHLQLRAHIGTAVSAVWATG